MKVLQIEFNELSPALLEQLMAAGELPNFRRFHESSQVFTTDAHAEPPELEPWVQWPTVHLGVSHEEHGLRHLGLSSDKTTTDQLSRSLTPVGEVLSRAGLRVGIFGSMNVPYGQVNGFYLPDPWNASAASAHPDYLAPFLHTVGTMVRDSSRTEGESPGAGIGKFGVFMLKHGLTPATVAMAVKQLASERRDSGVRWRRASVLDWIQYDVFRNLVKRESVDFATFFSNSTAHYQHYYWRNMQPEGFDLPPDPDDHPSYTSAIQYGYRSMDRILGRMMKDFPDTTLVLCTALSQQPWTDATKQTYRPRSWAALLELVGYSESDVTVQPVMAEEFIVTFASPAEAEVAREKFAALSLEGEPLMKLKVHDDALYAGCDITRSGVMNQRITGTVDGSEPTMGDLFTPIHTVRSGRHDSSGVLWFRTGQHAVHQEPVGLEDIAPTVMRLLGVEQPEHMRGRALLEPAS